MNGVSLLTRLARAKRLPVDFLRELGLHDLDGGRAVGIPYYGVTGEDIAVKRRTALKATEGSLWPRGRPLTAYGQWRLDAAAKAGFLIIVEGESDCWALWHHQLPALGIPGANAVKALEREHVEAVQTIYVHHEADRGGDSFVEGVPNRLAALGWQGKLFKLRMPDGIKDPADLHAADPEAFKGRMEEAIRASVRLELSPTAEWNGQRQSDGGSREATPAVEIFTAADLHTMELPEPRWAVQGILPDGLSLLAGKPKLGKSWLALNLALAVATGGVALGSVPVERGEVLYLALEDTKRRLKDRIAKLGARQELRAWPATLHLARSWPRQDKGGLFALLEWLAGHPRARLVVLDTWPKFRPFRARGRDSYEEDYQHASEVKTVADKYGLAILALAHCRKLDAADPLDEVSGTLGLTGAADGVAVLKRERGQHDATLFVTGRDVDERQIALRWEPQYALWSILGEAEEYRLSKERKEVIELLDKAGKPLSPKQAADLLGKNANTVKSLLWNMARDGHLVALDDGTYTSANCANPTNRANRPSDPPTVGAVGAVGAREREPGEDDE
jgi:hypothetical protein